MDIQGYILDHWMGDVKVIDTTQAHLHARLSAQRYWCKELSLNKDARMVIYRKRTMPNNNRLWVEEPYAAFVKGGCIFPQGPQDIYENICRSFLPAKQNELNQLFEVGVFLCRHEVAKGMEGILRSPVPRSRHIGQHLAGDTIEAVVISAVQ